MFSQKINKFFAKKNIYKEIYAIIGFGSQKFLPDHRYKNITVKGKYYVSEKNCSSVCSHDHLIVPYLLWQIRQ